MLKAVRVRGGSIRGCDVMWTLSFARLSNTVESLPVLMSLGTVGSGGEVEFLEWQVVSAVWTAGEENQC